MSISSEIMRSSKGLRILGYQTIRMGIKSQSKPRRVQRNLLKPTTANFSFKSQMILHSGVSTLLMMIRHGTAGWVPQPVGKLSISRMFLRTLWIGWNISWKRVGKQKGGNRKVAALPRYQEYGKQYDINGWRADAKGSGN